MCGALLSNPLTSPFGILGSLYKKRRDKKKKKRADAKSAAADTAKAAEAKANTPAGGLGTSAAPPSGSLG